MTTTIKHFAYAHLPAHLQAVSAPIGDLANKLEAELPDGPEKSAGMRKLLEAKDCFVRAALESRTQPLTFEVFREVAAQQDQLKKFPHLATLADKLASQGDESEIKIYGPNGFPASKDSEFYKQVMALIDADKTGLFKGSEGGYTGGSAAAPYVSFKPLKTDSEIIAEYLATRGEPDTLAGGYQE